MRNDSPFAAIIGIPGRWPDNSDRQLDVSFNIANHSIFRRCEEEFLLVDGETYRLQMRFQKRLHDRIKLGVSVPWISHSGGFLDSTIDTWHEITGLREGIRPERPQDELRYSYGRETFEIFGLDDSESGLGDTQVALAITLRRAEVTTSRAWPLRLPLTLLLNAELPTGDLDRLTGNDHTDYAAGLRVSAPQATSRLQWWADAGIAWPGDVDIAGLPPKDQVFYFDLAFSWRWLRNLDLILDVAGNSPLYRSEIKSLGDPAMQIAAGFAWHRADGSTIRVGFYEDLRAESASDFGLEVAFTFAKF